VFSQCFGILQVRKSEISLRQWSAGAAQLRTLEGTLVLLHANANYALFWQQCFFSHNIKHRRSQGGAKEAMSSPKFLVVVILCFGRRFSKQNIVIRLKSNVLASPKFLG